MNLNFFKKRLLFQVNLIAMKKILVLFFLLVSLQLQAQISDNLFGIVRKNYYSIVVHPTDSTITYEQSDSATIRLGVTDPSDGFVYNFGSNSYTMPVNLTGAALNPYDNTFTFIGSNNINTLNLR